MYDDFSFNDEVECYQETDDSRQAQTDITELAEDEFECRYKATKEQYKALYLAIKELYKAKTALRDMGALNIDPELLDNTQLLIEDYSRLLEQMHMASYWEQESNGF